MKSDDKNDTEDPENYSYIEVRMLGENKDNNNSSSSIGNTSISNSPYPLLFPFPFDTTNKDIPVQLHRDSREASNEIEAIPFLVMVVTPVQVRYLLEAALLEYAFGIPFLSGASIVTDRSSSGSSSGNISNDIGSI